MIVDTVSFGPANLPGPTVKRGSWTLGFCPAHADGAKGNRRSGQSLGLSTRGVLTCFATCDDAAIAEALGIARGTGRNNGERPTSYKSPGGAEETITTWYDYRDADGVLRYIVGRTPTKAFPVFHLDGGRWRGGYGGVRLLYRLPELLASDPEEIVLFCEGEKDADRARREGFVAVCIPGGASSGDVKELDLSYLKNRRVVLVPDKDEAGAKLTAVLTRRLAGVAA